jgi:hypothetical protein
LDATGKEVYRNYFNTEIFQIDLQDLNSGIYILKVQTFLNESEVYYTERIIVSK